ncbi:hypothetical protein [Parapedobacter tibetensis]|uniref:hypothetical protein n=1 Tax=Parapedobacter tibetensis TaxID=2972951 RepID=UPI00214D9D2D|nr:hypothetical protein [Parapedobacter tibetensis]
MTTPRVEIDYKKSEKAVLAVLKALGVRYQVEEEESATAENPSPSGDKWFLDPENMAKVKAGIADVEAGRTKAYSLTPVIGRAESTKKTVSFIKSYINNVSMR